MKRRNGTGEMTRRRGVEKHESGALEDWGGVVSGHVSDYADAFGVSPEAVLQAAGEVELLLDTAEPKGQGKDRDRPTDPALRCLAMTTESARRLAEIIRSTDTELRETAPAHA